MIREDPKLNFPIIGDGVTYTMPIHEGRVITSAINRIDLGGHDLTEHMVRLLTERGYVIFATIFSNFIQLLPSVMFAP